MKWWANQPGVFQSLGWNRKKLNFPGLVFSKKLKIKLKWRLEKKIAFWERLESNPVFFVVIKRLKPWGALKKASESWKRLLCPKKDRCVWIESEFKKISGSGRHGTSAWEFQKKSASVCCYSRFGRSSSDRLKDMQVARKQTVPMALCRVCDMPLICLTNRLACRWCVSVPGHVL